MQLQVKHSIGRKWEPEYFHCISLQRIVLADVGDGLQEGTGRLLVAVSSAAGSFQQFSLS